MIVVQSIELNDATKTAKVMLGADNASEVQSSTTADYVGFPEGYEVEFFSKAMTAEGDLLIYGSNGWV